MAQVKFNRGTRAAIAQQSASLTTDQVTFGSSAGTYDSIYLGTFLVGTSMIGLMTPAELKTPVYTYSGETVSVTYSDASIDATSGAGHFKNAVITADWNGTSAITTARRLVDWETIEAGGYTLTDSDILTAKAVTSLITASAGNTWYENFTESNWTWTAAVQDTTSQLQTDLTFTLPIADTSGGSYNPATDTTHLMTADQIYAVATGNNTYHGTGTWDSTDWNVYTAKYYKNGTEVASSATGYQALSFTLPVHTWSNAAAYSSDSTHLTTPSQVAQYLSTVAGAMEYKGSLTAASAQAAPAAYKPGDVFIASGDYTIGTSPTKSVEDGDMIIVNTAIAQGAAFTPSNCDVFERNLDGAVTAVSNFTQNAILYSDGTAKTATSAQHITVSESETSAELTIVHVAQGDSAATTVNVAEALCWHELS